MTGPSHSKMFHLPLVIGELTNQVMMPVVTEKIDNSYLRARAPVYTAE